jgi:macrolide transport system ATP-binding/permease protein
VAAVIALLAIGEGAKQRVLAQLAIFGTNRMYVIPGGESSRGPAGSLLTSDADIIRDLPNVSAAMPYLKGAVTIRAGNVDYRTEGVAVTTDFPRVLNWVVENGVFFNQDDERSLATVAVIGKKLAGRVLPNHSDPVRQLILVNSVPFEVIGVLSSKGALSGDSDDDDTIVFPFSTGSARVFGKRELSWISVLIDDLSRANETADTITAVLERTHHLRDFRVFNKAATIQAQDQTQNTLTLLLGFTAAISLIVGAIGVMNVMLMTVTERTREIGIRVATGARTIDILRQFLTEAMIVSGAGGLTGIVVGLLVGVGAATFFGMPVIFSTHAIGGALLCALLTGLLFGFMPAYRAARLDPVAALARQ